MSKAKPTYIAFHFLILLPAFPHCHLHACPLQKKKKDLHLHSVPKRFQLPTQLLDSYISPGNILILYTIQLTYLHQKLACPSTSFCTYQCILYQPLCFFISSCFSFNFNYLLSRYAKLAGCPVMADSKHLLHLLGLFLCFLYTWKDILH